MFKLIRYFISLIYWSHQPVEKVRKMQLRKFKKMFEYARANSPFYKELYTKAGVMDLDIQSWEDVEKVPVVDKDVYRSIPLEKRMTAQFNSRLHNIETTSGSSGNPLQIAFEKWADYTGHLRVLYMLMKAAHYTPFSKILMIARYEENAKFGIEKDMGLIARLQKLLHLFEREIISIYRDPDYIIEHVKELKPKILWTTPSVMEIVVNRLIVRNERFDVPYLFFTSENVSKNQFEKFKSYVSQNIIDLYGAAESPSISYDINKTGKSRVFVNACMPEYIDRRIEGGKDIGTIVITNLINKVTPFIRYNLKDYGEILDSLDFPNKVIGPVVGRMDDILSFPDGKPFFHHMAHEMFMDFTECLMFKFIQVNDGPITLQLRPNPQYEEAVIRERAMKRWKNRFPAYELKIEFVEGFQINAKTGKFKNIEKIKTK